MSNVTATDIRSFLMDRTTSDNPLLDDLEFSNEDLAQALQLACDKYNSTPPLIDCPRTPDNFPYRYELIIQTAANLLRSAAINMERNKLDVTSQDGTAVQDKNKGPAYVALAKDLSAEFDQRIKQLKISANMEACWGRVGGGFA